MRITPRADGRLGLGLPASRLLDPKTAALAVPIFPPPILRLETCILILLCCPPDQCTSERARTVKIIRR